MRQETYRITAVRVVEFHNLGTTTIELPEGGHLFLLGDNGSGKTTILDAIHLVLTAGREMEFNSAARVAGAKDSGGRTIQGIVLRYNAVTGRPARETGISYAAVELRSDSGKTCSLAIGLSAEGMDVAYGRWGGIASVPVAELPLVIEEEGRYRAAAQAEFKQRMSSLSGGRYYGHISDYAEAVGERFFGGENKFVDVCKLLRTGKAYREIAARAANYDDLFRRLLEDPSRDTFEPLLKGLRELEESKGRLDQIDERAGYLQDLRRESERLGKLRLQADVVSWTEAERMRSDAAADAERLAAEETGAQKSLNELEIRCADLKAEAARARERLLALCAKDSTGLLQREKSAEERLSDAERKLSEAESRYAADKAASKDASKRLAAQRKHCAGTFAKYADAVASSAKAAGFAAGGVTDALYSAANGAVAAEVVQNCRSLISAVSGDIANELTNRSIAADRARAEADKVRGEADAKRRVLDELRSRKEILPDVPGFAASRGEIRSQMLNARPLYELLEPADGCDASRLAVLERLAGDEFLSSWVASRDEADAVRRVLWRDGSGLTVCVRDGSGDVDVHGLAGWIGTFVSFEKSDVDAVKLLARHLSAKAGPEAASFLESKTWRFRGREGLASGLKPRLIGNKAREAEQTRLVRAAEATLAEAERMLKAAEKNLAANENSVTKLKELADVFKAAEDSACRENDALLSCIAEDERKAECVRRTEEILGERRRSAAEAKLELEDVRIRMRTEGIDGSLEKRIASAEKFVEKIEREADAAGREIGKRNGIIDALARKRESRQAEAESAEERASHFARRLCSIVPEGSALNDFAAEFYPQCMKDGADYSALREELAKESGAAESRIEQRIRDPKGETYAFSFDKAANVIADRRGVILADVLLDESRRLEELRGVLNQKSREVFERIFMGEVMQRLYFDLMRITDLTGRIHKKLSGRKFGSSRYQFSIVPVPEYEAFVGLVRKGYMLDAGGERDELREYLESHREEILNAEIDTVPDIFDYRKWFRFELKVVTENEEGRVIDRKVKSMGSGGEQAVPNYLLILTVAEFLYHGGTESEQPKLAPILFDEAFYGIDAARRDQLLAFADDLGLQLFVSSPDQDGVKREIRHSVSLIVVKDENLDVHLTPVVWRNTPTQGDLLGGDTPANGMTVGAETR